MENIQNDNIALNTTKEILLQELTALGFSKSEVLEVINHDMLRVRLI